MATRKMTLEEKTQQTNLRIDQYRATSDLKFKTLAYDIIEPDLKYLINIKFYFNPQLQNDILSAMQAVINPLMEPGSAFDTSKKTYIVVYAQKNLIKAGYDEIAKQKLTLKTNQVLKNNFTKFANLQLAETPNRPILDIAIQYVRDTSPNLSEKRVKLKAIECVELYQNLHVTSSLDAPIDDEGTTRAELIADNYEIDANLLRDELRQNIYYTVQKLKEKKILSPLEEICLTAKISEALYGSDLPDSAIAKKLGKSRQNFDRALKSAREKFKKYYVKLFGEDEF